MNPSKNLRCLVSLILAAGFASVSGTTVWAGSRLAFLSSRKGPAQIYVLDEKGEARKVKLTPDKPACQNPQLSPDGRWISFCVLSDTKD